MEMKSIDPIPEPVVKKAPKKKPIDIIEPIYKEMLQTTTRMPTMTSSNANVYRYFSGIDIAPVNPVKEKPSLIPGKVAIIKGLYNLWKADDGNIYLRDPNSYPNTSSLGTEEQLLQRVYDRWQEFRANDGMIDEIGYSEYTKNAKAINNKYADIGSLSNRDVSEYISPKQPEVPDVVDEEEEIIVNFEELADHFARKEFAFKYGKKSVTDSPDVFAKLVKDNIKQILSFKRNKNG